MRCCFTGHRPKDLYGYNDRNLYFPLIEKMKKDIIKLHEKGYEEFISGTAQGVDQISFWAVNSIKQRLSPVKNTIYIPFEGVERQWKEKGLFGREEFYQMVKLSDEAKIVSHHIYNDKQIISSALFKRNHAMVDDSELVYGVYHGPDIMSGVSGGTAECLRYAVEKGKEIIILDPFTLQSYYYRRKPLN